jgi:hypothetical protein
MQEDLQVLEALTAERTSLRLLIGELLVENQTLRMKIVKLTEPTAASSSNGPATRPLPHPGH